MSTTDKNLAERTGGLVESHKNYDPRIVFFYFVLAGLLVTLVSGLAYRQLFQSEIHGMHERRQNQRRVLVPGPRGNIYDRDHTLLVGNRPQFSVVLYIDELKDELFTEHNRIHKNYLKAGEKKDVPSYTELEQIARVSLAQRYLDRVNAILHRSDRVDMAKLRRHFQRALHLPYPLLEDLSPEDYARLLERLPVNSPLQVYSSNARFYPYGSTAAHTLGYVRPDDEVEAEDFEGDDLKTIPMKGTSGKGGLELQFDSTLQGEAGGSIFRVDPAGFKVPSPDLPHRLPVQGKSLVTSLDLDLQIAAEEAIGDQTGAAVAIDVATGEVLVLASKPDYDLSKFSPRATQTVVDEMNARGAWNNLAVNGFYPPGSTFKILTTIAGLRKGAITPDEAIVDCEGTTRIAGRPFYCFNGQGHHGEVLLREAITQSCDIYFYYAGILTTPETIAAEARRFRLDQRTGIELPGELHRSIIPDPEWKKRANGEGWFQGDTANMSIGQGFVQVSPLEMACFAASVARGEISTKPTLLHDPDRPRQRTESIGLTVDQRNALLDGMEGCTTRGSAKILTTIEGYRVPGVRIAGKTGTAQIPGKKNIAWFICFAPLENPKIAMAIAIEGDSGEEYQGGLHAAPVASAVLKKYFAKKDPAGTPLFRSVKSP